MSWTYALFRVVAIGISITAFFLGALGLLLGFNRAAEWLTCLGSLLTLIVLLSSLMVPGLDLLLPFVLLFSPGSLFASLIAYRSNKDLAIRFIIFNTISTIIGITSLIVTNGKNFC